MFRSSILATVILTGIGYVTAQSPIWGQCGGLGWSGPTTCVSGSICNSYNPYYSQCIPGPATTASSSSTSRSSTTSSTTRSSTSSTRTTTTTSTSTRTVSSTTSTATSTGYQIRGVSDPVYHLYLQSLGGVPVLGPEASSGYFNISGSIRLNSSPYQYLNIISSTNSYKTLAFNSTATFTGWALEGDTIITSQSSTYGRQLNFLACPASTSGYYQLYLQTGNDVPSSSCTLQTIHLPCLC